MHGTVGQIVLKVAAGALAPGGFWAPGGHLPRQAPAQPSVRHKTRGCDAWLADSGQPARFDPQPGARRDT
ncbi:MAG TPA: hypothetical protein VFV57_09800, partial [Limnobacter sp.]|nr:hypothetical protein [Limnobacter sp.]